MGCPDWTGKGKNWEVLQAVEHHTYRLGSRDKLEHMSPGTLKLQLFKQPSSFGGMRYATLAMAADGEHMVVKRILKEGLSLDRNRRVLEVSCSFESY